MSASWQRSRPTPREIRKEPACGGMIRAPSLAVTSASRALLRPPAPLGSGWGRTGTMKRRSGGKAKAPSQADPITGQVKLSLSGLAGRNAFIEKQGIIMRDQTDVLQKSSTSSGGVFPAQARRVWEPPSCVKGLERVKDWLSHNGTTLPRCYQHLEKANKNEKMLTADVIMG